LAKEESTLYEGIARPQPLRPIGSLIFPNNEQLHFAAPSIPAHLQIDHQSLPYQSEAKVKI